MKLLYVTEIDYQLTEGDTVTLISHKSNVKLVLDHKLNLISQQGPFDGTLKVIRKGNSYTYEVYLDNSVEDYVVCL